MFKIDLPVTSDTGTLTSVGWHAGFSR